MSIRSGVFAPTLASAPITPFGWRDWRAGPPSCRIKVKGAFRSNGHVVYRAHTHSLIDEGQERDCWSEPLTRANCDFTRVLSTTTWNHFGGDQAEISMVQLPPDWIDTPS